MHKSNNSIIKSFDDEPAKNTNTSNGD